MRLYVDQKKCRSAGVCVAEMPRMFRFQEGSKKAQALKQDVPEELEQRVAAVAAVCPYGAIEIS
jgi:ferredoxin